MKQMNYIVITEGTHKEIAIMKGLDYTTAHNQVRSIKESGFNAEVFNTESPLAISTYHFLDEIGITVNIVFPKDERTLSHFQRD